MLHTFNFNSEIFMTAANVKLPAEKFMTKEQQQREAMPDAAQEPKNIVLNSSDELFADLRDKNIDAVNALVCKKLKLLSAEFDVNDSFFKSFFNLLS